MTADEKKAFYINAYNVFAIETLLENPGKKITDIGGAFNKDEAPRRRRDAHARRHREPAARPEGRAHPFRDRLRLEVLPAARAAHAYTAAGLNEALERQGRAFVNDPSKNVIDKAKGRVALSKIFFWDRKEFERDGGTLMKFVSRYAGDAATTSWLAAYPKDPEFLDYDWSPNQP